jgi:NAD(P)-dependent dehydrogenase (short-subunit alcohol dehydrogenase family)
VSDRLAGKAVVVTGSGRGLGRAYAMAAAAEGASVVVNDIDGDTARETAEWIRGAGHIAVANAESVAEPEGAERLVGACVDRYGRIDGLVNNAGLIIGGPPWDLDPADARRVVDVNVLGVVYSGLAAIRRFRAQGHGVIVNVTSGGHLGMPGLALYGATKGAVASLTYGWARDLAGDGIRVIGYSPLAQTRMAQTRTTQTPMTQTPMTQTPMTQTPTIQNAPGLPNPDRVALAVPYLLSDESAGLSGQVVRFDGTNLSLLRLPAFAGPFVSRDDWTVDAVAEGFATTLRATLGPIGLPPIDLTAGP